MNMYDEAFRGLAEKLWACKTSKEIKWDKGNFPIIFSLPGSGKSSACQHINAYNGMREDFPRLLDFDFAGLYHGMLSEDQILKFRGFFDVWTRNSGPVLTHTGYYFPSGRIDIPDNRHCAFIIPTSSKICEMISDIQSRGSSSSFVNKIRRNVIRYIENYLDIVLENQDTSNVYIVQLPEGCYVKDLFCEKYFAD